MPGRLEVLPEERCRGVAARQRGLLTREQALGCGMTSSAISRRTAGGAWQRVLPNVYWLGLGGRDWRTNALATSLWAGAAAAVSHEAAAVLWGLDGFAPGQLVVTTTRSLRSPSPLVRVHRRQLYAPDVTQLHGIDVTTPCRTLLDLAATHGDDEVERALDDALRRHLVSVPRLQWFVTAHGGKGPAGTKTLKRLIVARGSSAPLESTLEQRAWRLFASSDLPDPVPQHKVVDSGELVARVDFAYPDVRLAIEVDGYRWHSGRTAWARDLKRRNRLTALGWRVVHLTHDSLAQNPDAVVDQVRALLSCAGEPPQRAWKPNFGGTADPS